ncbi:hypothetical protein PAXRUDRAFT_832195 [Paxillus rubicundulus Ve08.2h10]|uniref:Uncharacterized protein n=1 Tax=Paxillus rubicundulus Ve08.2h10 TaxID=930991 RepID=A0A0D0DRS1_9AGAM|nr:hypothetical protein PAXRUDRAFT_832195 [Paxillus rubicundulus Ve08.2h10]
MAEKIVYMIITEYPPPSNHDNDIQSPDPSQKHLATLSTVVQIAHNNFWLTSDAGWRGSTTITPHLHDAKATCIGVAPHDTPIFLNDFPIAVDNARNLQQQTATPDLQLRYGFTCNGQGQSTEFKFRHVLFERTTEKGDPHLIEGTVDLNGWPVHSDAAENELMNMKTNYRATPLAAYDVHDRLIDPASYRQ